MARSSAYVLAKNGIANICRGGAAAIVAIAMPPFLSRWMSRDAYGAWMLVLQMAAYSAYFDFGIQTAVSRHVAHYTELGDHERRNSLLNTAFVSMLVVAIALLPLMLLAAFCIPKIFPAMPASLVPNARLAFLILGASLLIGLPCNVFNGAFVGLQRNELSAFTIGGGRLLGAAAAVLALRCGFGIVGMSVAMAAGNFASSAVQFVIHKRVVPGCAIRLTGCSTRDLLELKAYCISISIWSLSMLLVTGLDVIIVGRYAFSSTAAYSLASSLIVFLAGLANAAVTPLISHVAALEARGDSTQIASLLFNSTRYLVLALTLLSLPVLLYAPRILAFWVGPSFASEAAGVLRILALANLIRLIGCPYACMLISTGQQRLVRITPVVEGIANLIASVVLVKRIGAIGVAYGTLIGSALSIGSHLLYNMPRTKRIAVSPSRFAVHCALVPTLWIIPAIAAFSAASEPAWLRASAGMLAALLLSLAAIGKTRFAAVNNLNSAALSRSSQDSLLP